MIPKSNKFPLRTQFVAFRAHAKRLVTPHFTLFYSPSVSTRLGVVVPKKTSKLATTRTWLKRLTYDTLYPQTKYQRLDLVVVYKPLPLKKSPTTKQQIVSEIMSLKFN